jgi:Tfp pilus assembly protein PilP
MMAEISRRKVSVLSALLLSVVTFAACGESSEDKAKNEVCAARGEISKQITKLQGLTLSSSAVDEAKSGLEVIGKELRKIKDAETDLEPARKEQVEAATKTFEAELKTVASEVGSSLSSGNLESVLKAAGPKIKSALNKLAGAYQQALAPIDCS